MRYSPGNNRRGKGQVKATTTSEKGQAVALDAAAQFSILKVQLQSAIERNMHVSIYQNKLDELLESHPELQAA